MFLIALVCRTHHALDAHVCTTHHALDVHVCCTHHALDAHVCCTHHALDAPVCGTHHALDAHMCGPHELQERLLVVRPLLGQAEHTEHAISTVQYCTNPDLYFFRMPGSLIRIRSDLCNFSGL